ncbi:MAG: hypothetical protein MZU95_00150 [Desulfomicrobium escambiense]|nr:hypothetical protein [Desulfomicrobium escambiense]
MEPIRGFAGAACGLGHLRRDDPDGRGDRAGPAALGAHGHRRGAQRLRPADRQLRGAVDRGCSQGRRRPAVGAEESCRCLRR